MDQDGMKEGFGPDVGDEGILGAYKIILMMYNCTLDLILIMLISSVPTSVTFEPDN